MIYLQLIKYFLPKTAEDDWFLFLLGLTQVLIGSVINQGDMVGAWLFVWAMLAVWVLGLFFLQREIRRFREGGRRGKRPASRPRTPYRGLFDVPFVAATFACSALTLSLGGLFFLLLPRQAGATRSWSSGTMARHLTGFDEEVKLGQLGEILENDSVVMSVEFTDENRMPMHLPGEPLFRGVTLSQYENRTMAAPVSSVAPDDRQPAPSATPARASVHGDPPDHQARAQRLDNAVRHAADPRALGHFASGPVSQPARRHDFST